MMKIKLSITPLVILELIFSLLFILAFGVANFLAFIGVSMLFGFLLLAFFWHNLIEFKISDFKDTIMQFAFVISGILFIIPGVLSSFFGILVLLFAIFSKNIKKNYKTNLNETNLNETNEDIIDVEIIEEKKWKN